MVKTKNKKLSSAEIIKERMKNNNIFLLFFFGIIIVVQLIGIALRNFHVNSAQLIGIGIGLAGYSLMFRAYLKEKKK